MESSEFKDVLRERIEGLVKARLAEAEAAITAAQAEIGESLGRLLHATASSTINYSEDPTLDQLSKEIGAQIGKAAAESSRLSGDLALLRDSVVDIDSQQTQADVLNVLVDRGASFAPRVILFVVKGQDAIAWAARGFDDEIGDSAVRGLSVPLAGETVLGAVLATGATFLGVPEDQTDNAVLLDRLGSVKPERITGIPLRVRGKVAAILYADTYDTSIGSISIEALELLVHSAGIIVELASLRQRMIETASPSYVPTRATSPYSTTMTPSVASMLRPSPAPEPAVEPEGTPTEDLSEEPQAEPETVEAVSEEVAAEPEVSAGPEASAEPVAEPSPERAPEPFVAPEVVEAPASEPSASPTAEQVAEAAPQAEAEPVEGTPAAPDVSDFTIVPEPDVVEETTQGDAVSEAALEIAVLAEPDAAVETESGAPAEVEAEPVQEPSSEAEPAAVEITLLEEAPQPPASEPPPAWSEPPAAWSEPPTSSPFSMEAQPSPFQFSTEPASPPFGIEGMASATPFEYSAEPESAPEPPVQVSPQPATMREPVSAAAEPAPSATGRAAPPTPGELNEEAEKLHNDARRFARLLVSEIKLYNEQKVVEGRANNDLYERLREDIDRSRQMYEKRVAPMVADRFDYFYDELLNTLAQGDAGRLGPDCPGPTI